ncbi:methyl-accepting chemotaxis protein [Kushneria phosphatilytica]|uniref:HAMP domain-containing protein n=1 Tax=Kushneria phosphatilytica TaxID=657387 RepID=A0A1S1NS23_9GAMM|nr:methyl-accepting chemotaxis protein [Kushneria phosphatilytica]OHV08814.1 methyl-accepting chemotaxis protein [Kushneria phosphatilytica]QEL12534.1 HAMP domain-containing protein [Kushneria phosphatilytica]
MKNLSIKWSLTLALGVLVVMVGIISALGFYSNNQSTQDLNELAEINVRQTSLLNRAQVNTLRARVLFSKYAELKWEGQSETATAIRQRAQQALDKAQQRFNAFQQIPLGRDSRRAPYVQKIEAAYQALVTETLQPLLNNDQLTAVELQRQQQRLDELAETFDGEVREFIHYTEQRGQQLMAANADLNQTLRISAISLLVLALIAAVMVRIAIMRMVVNPLQETVQHFDRIASGDLTARIEDRGRNEIGQLFAALRNMQGKLRELVMSLRHSSESVFSGSNEIASGSQDLSSRTEQQAASLEQTASSMEQMAATVRHNMDSAAEADQLSQQASRKAEEGGREVDQTVTTMREVAESSKQIHSIIEVIDGIAFQTNLLALNASVEAARAGEQGRGFAVVAGEVRSLAGRSADSAKEIRALIEETTQRIASGAEQSERSGRVIGEAVESIQRVTALMNEIASATREQNSGIEQINGAVTQMDSVTQQNAALVEQTSAAASSLKEQAEQLASLITTFRVDERDSEQSDRRTTAAVAPVTPAASTGSAVSPAPSGVKTETPTAKVESEEKPAPSARKASPARHEVAEEEWTEF